MKKIKGYENKYAVDEFGNVYSLNYNHSGKTKKLKSVKNTNGYLTVNLCKDKKVKKFKVHRLVAQTFLEDFSEDLDVDHIDRVKTNNKLSNLRMANRSQNKLNNNAAGCYWHKPTKKWMARIGWNKKIIHLGLFDSEEEAYLHYLDAKEEILEMI